MNIFAQMQVCETALLHTDFIRQPDLLELMLAHDFQEISGAGRSSREAVRQWLLQKDPRARWELDQFETSELTPDLRLVTYHARQVIPERSASKGSLHSSLWSYSKHMQCWQLRFHQASKLA
jgi:hypothetical protein